MKERLKSIWGLPNRYLVIAGFGLGLMWSSLAFTSGIWFFIGIITFVVFVELHMQHKAMEKERFKKVEK